MNPVVHFEMPFDDKARLSRFYEQAFGWQMQALGAEMGDYVLATTTASEADGRPKTPGAISRWRFPASASTCRSDSEGNRVSILQPLPR